MVRTRWHRLLVVLLVGVALGWPALKQTAGMLDGAGSIGVSMPDGHDGCDHGPAEDGSCPTLLCAVPPALVPVLFLGSVGAKADDLTIADERLRGRIPEIHPPPPRTSPRI
jgi:hypothetical protein